MRRYSASGNTAAGTTLVILEVIAATTTRGRIFDLLVSSDQAPADIATKFRMVRVTTTGTGTAFTPTALDPADPAALLSANQGTFSPIPTVTAASQLMEFALNQRATFRWVAVPDSELVIPATASNGIALYSVASGATPTISATMLWQE
jgi:hypothetical protein